MRKLISILIAFALAPATWAHNVDPPQGGTMTVSYFNTPGPGKISVSPNVGEPCTVTAQAAEIVVGTPLLSIQSLVQQPALEVLLSVTAIRRPGNQSETTAVHLSWSATGFTVGGSPDPQCDGAGNVVFNVTVIDGTQGVPTPNPLSVIKSGTGSGTVSSNPAGINCGSTCSGSFGGSVTLTATPATGSTFAGWSGACTGTGTCTVTMDGAKNVTAVFNLIPYATNVTKVITATNATITSTITFNQDDVGKAGSVYVTAWVPVSGLKALGITVAADSPLSVTSTNDNPSLAGAGNPLHTTQGPLSELDAAASVLVQLTSTGWQLVVNGQLIPYATGVLGDQLKAQTILQNTDITNLAGAQFCLGYGTSASDMTSAGRMQLIATLPESSPTSASAGTCLVVVPQAGVWWNTAEGGRGFVIEQRGSNLFFGAFLYDDSGRATWYAAAGATNGNTFSSSLTPYSGGQTLTGPYHPATGGASAGNVSITFTDASHGSLTWPGGTIPIQRFDIVTGGAALIPPDGTPETGIWWNPSESGRGFALEIQAGTMFMGGYMFDASGNPIWYSSGQTPMTNTMTYVGTWNQFGNGQTMTGSYKPATVVDANVGTVRIQFSDTQNATLTLPDGGQIPITRFKF